MEGSLEDLAQYRIKRAWEMLEAAKENLKIGQYKTALNRSYYAVFHAMRAANILRGFDSSKHSGVIAFFTKEFLKTDIWIENYHLLLKAVRYYVRNLTMMIFLLQAEQRLRNR